MPEKIAKDKFIFSNEILSAIGHGIIATDTSGKIIYMNLHSESILEITQANAMSKNFEEVFQLYHAETKERLSDPVTFVLQNRVSTGLEANSVLMFNHRIK